MNSRKRRLTWMVQRKISDDYSRGASGEVRTASILMISWAGRCSSTYSKVSVGSSVKRGGDGNMILEGKRVHAVQAQDLRSLATREK